MFREVQTMEILFLAIYMFRGPRFNEMPKRARLSCKVKETQCFLMVWRAVYHAFEHKRQYLEGNFVHEQLTTEDFHDRPLSKDDVIKYGILNQ